MTAITLFCNRLIVSSVPSISTFSTKPCPAIFERAERTTGLIDMELLLPGEKIAKGHISGGKRGRTRGSETKEQKRKLQTVQEMRSLFNVCFEHILKQTRSYKVCFPDSCTFPWLARPMNHHLQRHEYSNQRSR